MLMTCAVKFAMALVCISTSKKNARNDRDLCVFNEVSIFEYGLYMFCVAYMLHAHDCNAKCAMALFCISTSKRMQESISTCLLLTRFMFLNMDRICFV